MRTLLITGTSSGIGLATAVAAARAGFTTVATMRDLDRAGVDASWLARLADPRRKWVQLPGSFVPVEENTALSNSSPRAPT